MAAICNAQLADNVEVDVRAANKKYWVGDIVELEAIAVEADQVIQNVKIEGNLLIKSDDGRSTSIALAFGLNPAHSIRGMQRASFAAPLAGEYVAEIHLNGVDSKGRTFSKVTSTSFQVHIPRAKLLGLTEHAVRTAAGAPISRIEVTAGLDVFVAGEYGLSFDLVAANGERLTGGAQAKLKQGAGELIARFKAEHIEEFLNQDGPYRISLVRIYAIGVPPEEEYVAGTDEVTTTRPYRLADLDHGQFHIEEKIRIQAVDRTVEGRFATLLVNFDAVTPGGFCYYTATLTDVQHPELELARTEGRVQSESTRRTFELPFQGATISQVTANQRLAVPKIDMSCNGKQVEDRHSHLLPELHPSEFDNRPPGFEFIRRQEPFRIGAGDSGKLPVRLRSFGKWYEVVQLTVESANKGFKIETAGRGWGCPGRSPDCWRQGTFAELPIEIASDMHPGTYPVAITGRAAGQEQSTTIDVIVDPVLTARKHANDAAFAAMLKPEGAAPAIPEPKPVNPLPPADFSTGIELRKIHAMLVLDRSGSMSILSACEFMKAAATRFVRLFAADRDMLGVISFGGTVQLLPITASFTPGATEYISGITCFGSTNTGHALELARNELQRVEDPEAVNAVFLFTDGQPNALTADWPMNPATTGCPEAKEGVLKATVTLISQFSVYPPEGSESDERNTFSHAGVDPKQCMGHFGQLKEIAFLPERTLEGIGVAGTRTLIRIPDGPYAGKIRLDVPNFVNAMRNQGENISDELRSMKPPTYVYIVTFVGKSAGPMEELLAYTRRLAGEGMPNGGKVVKVTEPLEFWPALQTLRKEILEHAKVH